MRVCTCTEAVSLAPLKSDSEEERTAEEGCLCCTTTIEAMTLCSNQACSGEEILEGFGR